VWSCWRNSFRGDEADVGEENTVSGGVAGEEVEVFRLGAGPDVEIGIGGAFGTVATAEGEEGLGGHEAGYVGQRELEEGEAGEGAFHGGGVDILLAIEIL
jgi:hypothetical protein